MRKNISSGTQPKRKTDCLEQQKGISARKSKPADLFFIQVVVSWGKRLIFVPIPNHLLSSVPRNTLLLVTSVCRSLASPSCSSLTLGSHPGPRGCCCRICAWRWVPGSRASLVCHMEARMWSPQLGLADLSNVLADLRDQGDWWRWKIPIIATFYARQPSISHLACTYQSAASPSVL